MLFFIFNKINRQQKCINSINRFFVCIAFDYVFKIIYAFGAMTKVLFVLHAILFSSNELIRKMLVHVSLHPDHDLSRHIFV